MIFLFARCKPCNWKTLYVVATASSEWGGGHTAGYPATSGRLQHRPGKWTHWAVANVFVFCVNPRPAGVWIVTRPAGGGAKGPPLRSPKLLDRFPNFKRHSIAMYVNYPYKVKNLTRRSLMTSQVRSKSEFSTFRAWWRRRVKFRC